MEFNLKKRLKTVKTVKTINSSVAVARLLAATGAPTKNGEQKFDRQKLFDILRKMI